VIYSTELRQFLKAWEGGPFLAPHWDEIGEVWDIGYGHVIREDIGEERRAITFEEAELLLDFDMRLFEDGVSRLLTCDVAQCQFDALLSFAYNVGLDEDTDDVAEGLGDSTLLRYVNAGDFDAAADEFAKWNKGGGRVVAGLTKRRAAERAMFVDGDYGGRP
jgi:lysozyme